MKGLVAALTLLGGLVACSGEPRVVHVKTLVTYASASTSPVASTVPTPSPSPVFASPSGGDTPADVFGAWFPDDDDIPPVGARQGCGTIHVVASTRPQLVALAGLSDVTGFRIVVDRTVGTPAYGLDDVHLFGHRWPPVVLGVADEDLLGTWIRVPAVEPDGSPVVMSGKAWVLPTQVSDPAAWRQSLAGLLGVDVTGLSFAAGYPAQVTAVGVRGCPAAVPYPRPALPGDVREQQVLVPATPDDGTTEVHGVLARTP